MLLVLGDVQGVLIGVIRRDLVVWSYLQMVDARRPMQHPDPRRARKYPLCQLDVAPARLKNIVDLVVGLGDLALRGGVDIVDLDGWV